MIEFISERLLALLGLFCEEGKKGVYCPDKTPDPSELSEEFKDKAKETSDIIHVGISKFINGINKLEEEDLIEFSPKNKVYRITDKGYWYYINHYLSRIDHLTKKNAIEFFDRAEEDYIKNRYGKAYAGLVNAIEELAKHHTIHRRSRYLSKLKSKEEGELQTTSKSDEISEARFREVFKEHELKRNRALTQSLLYLLNTSDQEKRKLVVNSIFSGNFDKLPELKKRFELFRKMWTLRNKGLYVEGDASGPENIKKEDYDLLSSVWKPVFKELKDGQGSLISLQGISIEKIEEMISSYFK